tara:strand:- start:30488 stop:31885 length:1398 start_codon:yes stop_codon:yes gene_type:complete
LNNNLISPVIATIGPATEERKNLVTLLKLCDIVRINGGHNTLSWHKNVSSNVKKIDSTKVILIDVPGIKPRTLNKKPIIIKKGEKIIFCGKEKKLSKSNYKIVKLSNPLPKNYKKNKHFSISDGQFSFSLIKYGKNYVIGKSKVNFILLPNKGLNIPGSFYDENYQLKVYKNFLKKINNFKFDALGISYVQSEKIINKIRKIFPSKIIVSKIENSLGLHNSLEIIKSSDAIMIDRGDLAAEAGEQNLFNDVVRVSKQVKYLGRPLIIATENLESMIEKVAPTKSEIMSLGLNTLLGADKIMLSDETATSTNWKNTINWVNKFYNFTNIDSSTMKNSFTRTGIDENHSNLCIWDAIETLNHLPFVIATKSGAAIYELKKRINGNRIFVFTDSIRTYNLCRFWNGITANIVQKMLKKEGGKQILGIVKQHSNLLFTSNSAIATVFVLNPRKGARANALYIVTKKDLK